MLFIAPVVQIDADFVEKQQIIQEDYFLHDTRYNTTNKSWMIY